MDMASYLFLLPDQFSWAECIYFPYLSNLRVLHCAYIISICWS
jgi:hypothetical protein